VRDKERGRRGEGSDCVKWSGDRDLDIGSSPGLPICALRLPRTIDVVGRRATKIFRKK
jgi:hypothetical protein